MVIFVIRELMQMFHVLTGEPLISTGLYTIREGLYSHFVLLINVQTYDRLHFEKHTLNINGIRKLETK